MNKPYIVCISSQKGGVGKTTVATNFAATLKMRGYRVLLVDFDFVNPSIAFYLGLQDVNTGIHAVLSKNAKLGDVEAIHGPTGLHVLIGELDGKKQNMPGEAAVAAFLKELKKTNYQFVVIDTSPGYNSEPWIREFDEDIIITTPDVPACASAAREAAKYDKIMLKHSLVVNKVKNTRYELDMEAIRDMYGGEVQGVLYDDNAVSESLAVHVPVCIFRKRSRFSRSMRELAEHYATERGADYTGGFERRGGFVELMRSLFGKRLRRWG